MRAMPSGGRQIARGSLLIRELLRQPRREKNRSLAFSGCLQDAVASRWAAFPGIKWEGSARGKAAPRPVLRAVLRLVVGSGASQVAPTGAFPDIFKKGLSLSRTFSASAILASQNSFLEPIS
jgi:hypothetical protein